MAAAQITEAYGAPNLQYYKGEYHNANAIYDNLKNGYYDTQTYIFEKVDSFEKAEEYARKGGLVIITWRNWQINPKTNDYNAGHVAVLTGGYYATQDTEDSSNNPRNRLRIFQAGKEFGKISYFLGFGDKDADFYIWRKR